MDRNANRAWILALYKTTTRKCMKHTRPIPQKIPIIMTNTNPITALIASIDKIRSLCYLRTPLTLTMMTLMTTLTRMMMMMMMIPFFMVIRRHGKMMTTMIRTWLILMMNMVLTTTTTMTILMPIMMMTMMTITLMHHILVAKMSLISTIIPPQT